MQKFTVSLVRIEHRVHMVEVEAESVEDAEAKAMEAWESDDWLPEGYGFRDVGVVHAEEFVFEVKSAEGRVTSIG
jgi:hypothetical protein